MKLSSTLLIQTYITLLATASPLPNPLPLTPSNALPKRADPLITQTDQILYTYSMSQFKTAVRTRTPPELDWDSMDGCTGAPDWGFEDSCNRHDFGFANYRHQNRLCVAGRKSLDWQLRRDMLDYCDAKYSRWWKSAQRWGCKLGAGTYYGVVAAWPTSYSKGC